MSELYYTAPPDEQFEELRAKAIEIWKGYENGTSYSIDKIGRIKDIANVSDNFMYMVAMFDQDNMAKLARMLSPETRLAVYDRMKSGGQPDWANPF